MHYGVKTEMVVMKKKVTIWLQMQKQTSNYFTQVVAEQTTCRLSGRFRRFAVSFVTPEGCLLALSFLRAVAHHQAIHLDT